MQAFPHQPLTSLAVLLPSFCEMAWKVSRWAPFSWQVVRMTLSASLQNSTVVMKAAQPKCWRTSTTTSPRGPFLGKGTNHGASPAGLFLYYYHHRSQDASLSGAAFSLFLRRKKNSFPAWSTTTIALPQADSISHRTKMAAATDCG